MKGEYKKPNPINLFVFHNLFLPLTAAARKENTEVLILRRGKRISTESPRDLMLLAIDLARKSQGEPGKTIPPKVGAVLVKDGQVLGEAFRGQGEHAEFALLERILSNETIAGATLYTTLEPCTSRKCSKHVALKKIIPCSKRVIDRGIERVVIGSLDPDPQHRSKGSCDCAKRAFKLHGLMQI